MRQREPRDWALTEDMDTMELDPAWDPDLDHLDSDLGAEQGLGLGDAALLLQQLPGL